MTARQRPADETARERKDGLVDWVGALRAVPAGDNRPLVDDGDPEPDPVLDSPEAPTGPGQAGL